MPSELSVQERLLFDQIIEGFDRPPDSVRPGLRLIAGVAIALCGFLVLLATIRSTLAAFAACLVVAAGASLAVHARIRLGAFPKVQLKLRPSDPRPQRYRPSPGRPGIF